MQKSKKKWIQILIRFPILTLISSHLSYIGNEVIFPKGFYYQNKHIILVGNSITGDTIRRKEKISDVEIEIYKN